VTWLVGLIARMPATVHAKLLAAFLAIVVLLITVGAVGLQTLSAVNRRAENLVQLQRKIAAYRQLQHDTTSQLYSVSSALLVPDERTLEATLRQLNQFGYDLDRLQFVAKDEVELLSRVREDYDQFIKVVTQVVELIRVAKVAQGREVQLVQAGPLADRLERLTNELVNKAEADMVASIDATHEAYVGSRWVVIGFAIGSIALALVLGHAISWSLIGPVHQMEARLEQIATGDFTQAVRVLNRDELGALAAKDGSDAKLVGVLACHCGSLADGEKAVQPIKAFGPPIVDQMGPISYCTQNGLLDAALPKGALNYWKAHFLTDLRDDAIATLVACFEKCTSPMTQIVLEHFHGAASRVPVTDTACAMRITGFNVVLISQWSDRRESDRHIAWCRETYDALRPYLGSFRYVNYLAEDEVGDPVAAYGPNYQRLRALKAKYDPENFFHINANITPLHA